jgi:hypothetical protein
MEYAKLRMSMRLGNVRYSADPVDLGAQSDLIGVLEPMSIEAVLAAPNGGSGGYARPRLVTLGEGPPGGFPCTAGCRGDRAIRAPVTMKRNDARCRR